MSWSLARGLQDTARDSGMLLWVMFLAMDGREPDMCRVAGRLCRALTDGDARSLGVLTRSFPPGLLAPCPPDQVQYGAGHLRLGVDPLTRTSEVFCFFGSCWCWCSGRSPPLTLELACFVFCVFCCDARRWSAYVGAKTSSAPCLALCTRCLAGVHYFSRPHPFRVVVVCDCAPPCSVPFPLD